MKPLTPSFPAPRRAVHVARTQKDDSQTARLLAREYAVRAARAHDDARENALAALERRAVDAQREALLSLRSQQVIGDDAFHVVEAEVDLLELAADTRVEPSEGVPGTSARTRRS